MREVRTMNESLVEQIAKLAIRAAAPVIRKQIENEVAKLEAKADATKTPADDIALEFAKVLFGVGY